MERTLQERLAQKAYYSYYGATYADWTVMPEADRERWREVAGAVVRDVVQLFAPGLRNLSTSFLSLASYLVDEQGIAEIVMPKETTMDN